MALSIASAFRLRNKLKERIKKLTDLTERATVTKPAGTSEHTGLFDGKTFSDIIAEVSLLMATLRDFNIAIDKANLVNKEDLITLESLKAEIAFYDSIARNIRNADTFSYEYNSAGGRDKINLELVLDQKAVVTHLETLKKRKDAVEEKLAASNFTTAVNFDQDIINKQL